MIKPTKPTPIPVPPDAPIRGADGRPVFAVKAAAWIDYQEKKLWPHMSAVVTYNGKAVDYVDSQLTIVNTKANEAKASADLVANATASLPDGVIIDTQIGTDKTWSSAKISSIVVSNWTSRTAPDRAWKSVCWSPELGVFCAVAGDGAGSYFMVSRDGISWTTRLYSTANDWQSVSWSPELGLFCAVASSGTNRVITSSDGTDWIGRTAPDRAWQSVCWSPELGVFCAVASSGTGNRVMTSSNGVNWATRTAPDRAWKSVCWSPELGVFCAVAATGTGNRVMTSLFLPTTGG